jgi:hypothetical protein
VIDFVSRAQQKGLPPLPFHLGDHRLRDEPSYEDEFEPLDCANAEHERYAAEHGLTVAELTLWGVRWNPATGAFVHFMRDESGHLRAAVERLGPAAASRNVYADYRWWHWHTGSRPGACFYGEHRLDASVRKAIVVEGFCDTIALHTRGYRNVLGLIGTQFTPPLARFLEERCDFVVWLPDGDDFGWNSVTKFYDTVHPVGEAQAALGPWGRDPDQLSSSELEHLLGPPPFGVMLENGGRR